MTPADEYMAASLCHSLVLHTNVVPSSASLTVFGYSLHLVEHFLKSLALILIGTVLLFDISAKAQCNELSNCNINWTQQSSHSGESMPCGGGDIGLMCG